MKEMDIYSSIYFISYALSRKIISYNSLEVEENSNSWTLTPHFSLHYPYAFINFDLKSEVVSIHKKSK